MESSIPRCIGSRCISCILNADEGSNHLANAHKPNACCYVDERIRPGGRLLDHGETVAIGPDLIWYDRGDKPAAVIDAEYEMIAAGKSGPNAYMYQSTRVLLCSRATQSSLDPR